MCLYTGHYGNTDEIIRVAKKDIVVWKRVTILDDGRAISPFQGAEITPVMEEEDFSFGTDVYGCETIVNMGIHAYTNEALARRKAFFYTGEEVVKAIIPAGTKYILGRNDEIVSLCLIFWEQAPRRILRPIRDTFILTML